MPLPYPVRAATVALTALLAGCASLAPGAVTQLAALDPLTADPQALRLAAVMPVPTRLRSGDVVLRVSLDQPDGAIDESFALAVDGPAEAPGVVVNAGSERLQILKVAPDDLARLRAAQLRARENKAAGGHGRLGVTIRGGCKDGPIGDGPLIAAVLMRTSEGADYFPVMRSVNLRTLAGEAAIAALPYCD